MTDPEIVKYIDQMCVKNGEIEVKNIDKRGQYTLVVPVINGGIEFNAEQIATLELEFSFDGEDVILYHFPKSLLSDEDYAFITESIEDELFYDISAESEAISENSMNTKITYLYRDACNYKVYNECVINGVLTSEQKAIIQDCLDEGEYFIPSLVGLPEVKFDEVDDSEVDHPWFELQLDELEVTADKPTVSITPDKLVAAFRECKDKWTDLQLSSFVKPSLDVQIKSAEERHSSSGVKSIAPGKFQAPEI